MLHVRHKEVNQTVPENQGDQPGTASARECQFPCGKTEDNEIKGHSIDEGGGKNLVVCVDNRASALNPRCLQQHT